MEKIVTLKASDTEYIEAICEFLPRCFSKYSPSWLPDKAACLEQIDDSFAVGRLSRVLLGESGEVVGWISAFSDGRVWEIHPLAVSPEHQRKGIGKLLVADIESMARKSGAISVWAGTGDETNSTSFSDYDLYTDLPRALKSVHAPADHPLNFWLNEGYSIVGVMPDEEGLGKPGIHLAKRI